MTTTETETATPRAHFLKGLRLGVPFAIAGFLVALTFGIVARDAGLSAVAAIVMSLIVFAGSAQFASIAILAAGGGVAAAIGAGALMNSRFLMMGVALAPSLPGRWPWRAAQGQTVVDASWALAARGDGTFDRWLLFGSTLGAVPHVVDRARRSARSAAGRSATPTSSGSTRSTPRSSWRC